MSDTPKTTPNGRKERKSVQEEGKDGEMVQKRQQERRKSKTQGLTGTEQSLNIHAALWLPECKQNFRIREGVRRNGRKKGRKKIQSKERL